MALQSTGKFTDPGLQQVLVEMAYTVHVEVASTDRPSEQAQDGALNHLQCCSP